jgi:hypothetical protein
MSERSGGARPPPCPETESAIAFRWRGHATEEDSRFRGEQTALGSMHFWEEIPAGFLTHGLPSLGGIRVSLAEEY